MPADSLNQQDVERIARKALKELGVSALSVTAVSVGGDAWRIEYGGDRPINIKCGRGSTAQWVRTQIFDQYLSR